MAEFCFEPAGLAGAYIVNNFFTGDKRGWFMKSFEKDIFKKAGIDFSLNETFTSVSAKNVIRGLHFQTHHPQAKLVTVIYGRIVDIIVDLRPDSPDFKKWIMAELSMENRRGLFIPRGFAHGFASMEKNTVVLYQCDGKYDADSDTGIRYDDSEIGIDWPVDDAEAVHSDRDLSLPSFADYMKNPMKA